jgi:hypothetical protein
VEKQGETCGTLCFRVVSAGWQVQNRAPVKVLARNGTFFASVGCGRVDIRLIKTTYDRPEGQYLPCKVLQG